MKHKYDILLSELEKLIKEKNDLIEWQKIRIKTLEEQIGKFEKTDIYSKKIETRTRI